MLFERGRRHRERSSDVVVVELERVGPGLFDEVRGANFAPDSPVRPLSDAITRTHRLLHLDEMVGVAVGPVLVVARRRVGGHPVGHAWVEGVDVSNPAFGRQRDCLEQRVQDDCGAAGVLEPLDCVEAVAEVRRRRYRDAAASAPDTKWQYPWSECTSVPAGSGEGLPTAADESSCCRTSAAGSPGIRRVPDGTRTSRLRCSRSMAVSAWMPASQREMPPRARTSMRWSRRTVNWSSPASSATIAAKQGASRHQDWIEARGIRQVHGPRPHAFESSSTCGLRVEADEQMPDCPLSLAGAPSNRAHPLVHDERTRLRVSGPCAGRHRAQDVRGHFSTITRPAAFM